ncbi:MAG: ATP-binding cassette subfamily B protein [Planctomycetota bacterium]|jgi:ATP-binding cassette subfamily B protein
MSELALTGEASPEPDTGRVEVGLWRELFRYMRPYRRELSGLAVALVLIASVDATIPLLTRNLIDAVAEGETIVWTPYIWGYSIASVLLSACVLVFIALTGRVRTSVCHDIRKQAFANLQRLSFSYYDKRSVGWLVTRLTSDCDRLSNILAWGSVDVVWGITLMLAMSGVMFVLHWQLALAVVVTVPVLAIISVRFQRKILTSARIVRKTNSRMTAAYGESMTAVRTSKLFTREEDDLREFSGISGEMYGASMRNALQSALYLPVVMTIASLGAGLAFVIGGFSVASATISIGTLIAFLTYARLFFEPVHELAHLFAEMQMGQASAERILSLIAERSEVQDTEVARANIHSAASPLPDGVALDGFSDEVGHIRFEDVTFEYEVGQPILKNINLDVQQGQTVALVGPTGGGKSTLVSLLCRFYEPTAGRITIDDIEYRDRSLHWLQSSLGVVLQTPHLFAGSIADNVRYGRLTATDDEVREVARMVGAEEFIDALPDGFATEVGEGGVRLSTGQKQLISFARALISDPGILILDEATSSVDTETEQRIQSALGRVLEGRTSFVIAHRLSTIREADQILVIKGGQITEQGSHAELLAAKGHYHALYTRQALREGAQRWGEEEEVRAGEQP